MREGGGGSVYMNRDAQKTEREKVKAQMGGRKKNIINV